LAPFYELLSGDLMISLFQIRVQELAGLVAQQGKRGVVE